MLAEGTGHLECFDAGQQQYINVVVQKGVWECIPTAQLQAL